MSQWIHCLGMLVVFEGATVSGASCTFQKWISMEKANSAACRNSRRKQYPQELHFFLMNVMFPSQIRWAHGRGQINPFHHQFVDALCISTSIVNTWVAARPRMLSLVELNILGFPPRSCRYLVCSSVRSNLGVFWNRDWHDGFSPDQTELTRPAFLQKKTCFTLKMAAWTFQGPDA